MNDIDNPLEDIKVQAALRSQEMSLNYRKENNPIEINILDYTVIAALEKQMPTKTKIWEMSKYEDGEPFDNLICGNCEAIFVPNVEWKDLYDKEKIKHIIEESNIEESEWKYCSKCGQKIDWS